MNLRIVTPSLSSITIAVMLLITIISITFAFASSPDSESSTEVAQIEQNSPTTLEEVMNDGEPKCRNAIMETRNVINQDADWWTDYDAYRLLLCYMDNADWGSLEKAATLFIKNGPETSMNYTALANAQFEKGSPERAVETIKTALYLNKDSNCATSDLKQNNNPNCDLEVLAALNNNLAWYSLFTDKPNYSSISHNCKEALKLAPNACAYIHTALSVKFRQINESAGDTKNIAREEFENYAYDYDKGCIWQFEDELVSDNAVNGQAPLDRVKNRDLIQWAQEWIGFLLMINTPDDQGNYGANVNYAIRTSRRAIEAIGAEEFCKDALPTSPNSPDNYTTENCVAAINRAL